jgi:hypothetical protein
VAAVAGVLAIGGGALVQAANPVVSITPAQQNVAIAAGAVSYSVNIANADDVASFGFRLRFDPYVLKFTAAHDGGFLATSGRQLSCQQPFVGPNGDDVYFGCATVGDYNVHGAAGSGLLATIDFALIGGGASSVEFIKLDLTDPDGGWVCNGQACGPENEQNASITVDGPVLPRPTVDPAATATLPAAQVPGNGTPIGSAARTATPAAGAAASTATPVAGAAQTAAGSGTDAAGGQPDSGILGDSSQPGADVSNDETSGGATSGASDGSAQSGGGAGVGRFGSGPDSYAHGSDGYSTRAIALAVLGVMLIAGGVWQKRHYDRRVVTHRRQS